MSSSGKNLSLFPREALPPPAESSPPSGRTPHPAPAVDAVPSSRRQPARSPLWLAVALPWLPLDALADGDTGQPRAVHEGSAVVLADATADRAGVVAGQTLNAALALCPALVLQPRERARERAVLHALAFTLTRISPQLAVVDAGTLVLEVGGSLKLFGGEAALLARVQRCVWRHRQRSVLSLAATPLAAAWLARAGAGDAPERATLADRLAPLPLSVCDWPSQARRTLELAGVTRIGDCLRLPRDALARRVGPEALLALDRALGRAADPRANWRPPRRFRRTLELPAETLHSDALSTAAGRLLEALVSALTACQGGVRRLTLRLHHAGRAPTPLMLDLARAARDREHWQRLLAVRLEQLALPAPVIGLTLRTGIVEPLAAGARPSLFEPARRDGAAPDMPRLVERLQARLGADAVHGLQSCADHRPERAWRVAEPAVAGDAALPLRPRPLWLLPRPELLSVEHGLPWRRGRLRMLRGPERIESGWWDGDDVQRDYYVALDVDGGRLWVYRERRPPRRWFLHGLFG